MSADLLEGVHARIDGLFDCDRDVFGRDLAPYSGHAHRVAGLIMRQVDMRQEWVEPVAVAAYFHDAAIWYDHTWDYLPGSKDRAARELAASGNPADVAVVTDMIEQHHKIRPVAHGHPLVEAMRRADAADVYRLMMPPQVSRNDYRALLARFPDAGLHLMLARGFILGLKERKRINPMPMIKL